MTSSTTISALLAATLAAAAPATSAHAADRLWEGDAVVTRTFRCEGVGPIGTPGSRFHATLNPKLATAEAPLSLVLSSPEQTIAIRYDDDSGAIAGRGTIIDADGRVRARKALMFLFNINTLKDKPQFYSANGFLYDFGKPFCNIGFSVALIAR